MAASFAFGREALDFIQDLNHLNTQDAVMGSMQHAVGRHGFETLLFMGLPSHNQRFDDVVLGKRWPDEWSRIYSEGNYVRDDPIVRHLRRASRPFEWREVTYDAERYPRAAELMHLREDFGFGNAFVAPIAGGAGPQAAVSMGGARPDVGPWNKPALHMMALYAFETVSDGCAPPPEPHANLTPRECEVLVWAACGKSAWDTGEILSIATRTVNEHAQTAARKLGALNRTHAVALAMRDGLISI